MADDSTSTGSAEQISYLEQQIERLSLELEANSRQSDDDSASWQGPFGDMITLLLCFFIVMTAVMAIKQGDPFAVSTVITSMQEQGNVPKDIVARQEFLKNLEMLGSDNNNITVEKHTDKIQIIISNINLKSLKLDEADVSKVELFNIGNAHLTADAEKLLLEIAKHLVVPPKNTVKINPFIQILDQTFAQVRIEAHTDGRPWDPTPYFRTKWESTFFRAYNVRNYLASIEGFPQELVNKMTIVACADRWPRVLENDDFLFSLPPDWADKLEDIHQSKQSGVVRTKDQIDLRNIFSTKIQNGTQLASSFEIKKDSPHQYYRKDKHNRKYSILQRRSEWKIEDDSHTYSVRLEELEQLSISVVSDGEDNDFHFGIDPRTDDFFYQIQYLANTPSRKGRNKKEIQAQENRKKYLKNIERAFARRQVDVSDTIKVTSLRENTWHLKDEADGKTYHIRKGNLNVYRERPKGSEIRQLAQQKNNRIEIHLIIN